MFCFRVCFVVVFEVVCEYLLLVCLVAFAFFSLCGFVKTAGNGKTRSCAYARRRRRGGARGGGGGGGGGVDADNRRVTTHSAGCLNAAYE